MQFDNISQEEIQKFYKTISSNVRKYREEKDFTQLQLALAIGHNSSALLAKAETNTYDKHFNLEHLYKISKALDIPVENLLKKEENKK